MDKHIHTSIQYHTLRSSIVTTHYVHVLVVQKFEAQKKLQKIVQSLRKRFSQHIKYIPFAIEENALHWLI
jgi:seryl-tRNA synthetase